MRTYWKAFYIDGTSLPQFNKDGTENKYLDIRRDELSKFILYQDDKPKVVIHLDKNKKLICRKRIAMNMFSKIKEIVWLVGWQERRRGVNVQSLSFLFEDGRVEVLDRFKEEHPFESIIFLPEETLNVEDD